jgi:multiple sugar transport system permease protein
VDLHLISGPVDWLGQPTVSFFWLMVVAVFVSIPFTTFVVLAGLQSIPTEVHEAARVDGASPWGSYWHVTLPLLRPVLLIGILINLINVFNSFPIIWVMTKGGPGFGTDTLTTFMYKIAFRGEDLGQAAALAVLNFSIILVFVVFYLRATAVERKGTI